MRLHDLRHGFASLGVSTGEELHTVAALLGHSDLSTTMRYARVADATVVAAAHRIAEMLAKALTSRVQPAPRPPSISSSFSRVPAPSDLDEQQWNDRVIEYRNSGQRKMDFCRDRALDPIAFHEALLRFNARRRLARRTTFR